MAKKRMQMAQKSWKIEEIFPRFVNAQMAKGVSDKTVLTYNPIDRLVGLYNDVISTHLLSIAEYAKSTNETESEVKKRIEIAKLMVEFLEFINAPEQFYIARDLQLYFPLEELYKIIKKCHSEDEIEDLKIAVFTNILMQTSTDMGRFVRNIKTIVGTDYQEEFLDEQKLIAEKVVDSLPSQGQVNTSVIREVVRANDETVQELERSMDTRIQNSGMPHFSMILVVAI